MSALIVSASIDASPDPPAVNPHTANAKAACLREFIHGFCEQRLNCDSLCNSPPLPILGVRITEAVEPNRPSDWIVLAGHAADPSPPVL